MNRISSEPIDRRLFELTVEAVKEGLGQIERLQPEGRILSGYSDWLVMSKQDDGFPSFSDDLLFMNSTDWASAFSRFLSEPLVRPEELPTFRALAEYAESHQRLVNYFTPPTGGHDLELYRFFIFQMAERLIDRYIHLSGETRFSVDRFLPMYLPLEAGLLSESLRIDFLVPILFLRFESDHIELERDFSVELMSDELQLARMMSVRPEAGPRRWVLSSASHAFVVRGLTIPNPNYWQLLDRISDASAYPFWMADAFFSALRIACKVHTGYAQLLLLPQGWAHDYREKLPPVEGTLVRTYPSWFEDHYWRNPAPTLSDQDISPAVSVFSGLLTATALEDKGSRRLTLASHRLNRCFLRETEEDSVLDATIGMEALLSDGGTQEMTHKLALRMAALSHLTSGSLTSLEVLHGIKKVYNYRSAIVHGNLDQQTREISLVNGKRVLAGELATDLLRLAISALIQHPRYLDASKIDEELLLRV